MRTLVFVHGLLLSGWVFTRMEKYFRDHSYRCLRFNYPTRSKTIIQNAQSLKQWLSAHQINNPDFVCHSMGGLVCYHYFNHLPENTPHSSRVVCLGSPFKGSMVARSLCRSRLGRFLLGVQTDSELVTGTGSWPAAVQLGVIAGNRNLGAGRVLGIDASKSGDGTILVDETQVQGAIDHIVLPVSHSQMTFSKQVFEQTEYFLNNAEFKRDSL